MEFLLVTYDTSDYYWPNNTPAHDYDEFWFRYYESDTNIPIDNIGIGDWVVVKSRNGLGLARVLKKAKDLDTVRMQGFKGNVVKQVIAVIDTSKCDKRESDRAKLEDIEKKLEQKALGLLHKQIVKDSAMCRMGAPDYIVTLRKPGDNPEPIAHPEGFTQFFGQEEPEGIKGIERPAPDPELFDKKQKYNTEPIYSHQVWRRYANPVWADIRQTHTLNYKAARDNKDERHICPLQLDTVARCIELWSNPDDIVLDPFAGIGTVPVMALRMGRRALGFELKESYYNQSIINIQEDLNND